jgi:hypothetical protein
MTQVIPNCGMSLNHIQHARDPNFGGLLHVFEQYRLVSDTDQIGLILDRPDRKSQRPQRRHARTAVAAKCSTPNP